MNNLVSVVIPFFNRYQTLRDAIESVLMQTVKPSEILVINDGSLYSVHPALKSYFKHIELVSLQKNKGVSYARNVGISLTKSKYIAFLDSDDIFLPNKLEEQIDFMEKNKYQISHTDEFWYRENKWVNKTKNNERYGGQIFEKVLDKCRISPSSLVVDRRVFDKIGPFDENLKVCEDYEFSLRMALFYDIGYLDKKLIVKRAIEKNSLSASIKHIESIRYNILNGFFNRYKSNLNISRMYAVQEEIVRKRKIVYSGLKKDKGDE